MDEETDLSNEACPGEALDEEQPDAGAAGEVHGDPAEPKFYGLVKVAEIFDRSPRTVRHWIQRGLLKTVRIGKSRYVPASEFARLQREGGLLLANKTNENNQMPPKMQRDHSQPDRLNVIPIPELPGFAGFCQQTKEQMKMTKKSAGAKGRKAASATAMPLQMSFPYRLLADPYLSVLKTVIVQPAPWALEDAALPEWDTIAAESAEPETPKPAPKLVPPEVVDKAYLLKVIDGWLDLPEPRRLAQTGAIEKVAQIIERNRRLLAGAPPWSCAGLNRILWSQPPRVFRLEERHFQNTVSHLRSVLIRTGLHADSGHGRNKLSRSWGALYGLLTAEPRKRLIRFFRFLTLQGIEPDMLTPEIIKAFDTWVRNDILESDPCKLVRCVASNWTTAQKTIPGWPQVEMVWQGTRDHYGIPFAQFPASFRAEVEAFERGLMPPLDGDKFNPFHDLQIGPPQPSGHPAIRKRGIRRITSKRTVRSRMEQIRYAASALVLSGHTPLEEVRSLRDLVHPIDRPYAILKWHSERNQDRKRSRGEDEQDIASTYLDRIGQTLVYIAARYPELPEEDHVRLQNLVARVKPKQQCEMTPKNRQRLERLFEAPFYGRLLHLPEEWMKEVKKPGLDPKKAAVQAMYAVAMGILLFLPLRRSNLVQLRLDENIIFDARGRPCRIHIAANKVKNNRTIDWPIPPEDAARLALFIKVYRPLLLDQEDNSFLFPSKGPGHRNASEFGSTLAKRVTAHVGAEFHLHLARHFAAVQYLRCYPGEYNTVADILGHKSLEVTRKFYCSLEIDAAARRANDLLKENRRYTKWQGSSPRKPSKGSPSRGGGR